MEQKLRSAPQLRNVTTDLQIKSPGVRIDIDRDRAASLGVSPRQIDEALYDAYGSRQVSTIFTPSNQYWVVLELLPQYQRDVSALRLLNVRSSRGTLVPIGAVATLTSGLGPLAVSHSGQLPAVTLAFDVKPGVDPASVTRRLDELILGLRDNLGTTVVMVTHELDSIFAVADQAIFLDNVSRTVTATGDPRELLRDTLQRDARGGQAVGLYPGSCDER